MVKYFNKSVIFRPHNVYGPNGLGARDTDFISKINKSIIKSNNNEEIAQKFKEMEQKRELLFILMIL